MIGSLQSDDAGGLLRRYGQRMRAADGSAGGRWHSSLVADLCLTAALLIAVELEVVLGGLGADCAALAAVATLPLAVRRWMPVVSFASVAVVAPTLDRALGVPWGEDANALVFLILLASYSVGAHAPPQRSLAAMLGAVAWLAALEALWGDGEDYAFLLLLVGVPWLSGRGVRAYRVQAARLRKLAARLEEERAVSERVAVARERHRMAHETHDAIAHAVGEMVLQASGAEQVLAREPDRARRALAAIQRTGREAVDELRQVLGILRATEADPRSEDCVPAFDPTSRRRYWPASAETGLALLVLAVGVGYALDAADLAGHRAAGVVLQPAAAAAVALRPRRPFAAFGLSVAAFAGEALLVDGNPGSPAVIASLLLVTYSAAAVADRRQVVIVAALALGVPALVALVATDGDAVDLLLPIAIFGIPLAAGRAVGVYRRQAEELRILTRRLASERDARARLAVLNERARVARELHDSVAHAISVMVLQAGAADQVLDRAPDRAGDALRAVQDVGREALDQLARLLGLLDSADGRPPLAPHPGLADLERLLETVRRAGLPVRLRTLGDPDPLPAAVDGAAYRVIQEALTNALKHSGAAPTEVTVRYAGDGVGLEIVDRGRRSRASRMPAGHGLAGMRERIERHGGQLHAGPAADASGFAVSAFIPLAPAREIDAERIHA
jgi:signal transduction histidine kinase